MMHGTVILPEPDGSGGAASPRGDDAIWVEILSRHREIAARFRIAGPEVRIGRGYGNEVVVDDPYVAARHLRVFRDDAGQLIAEDLDSANGMFLDGGRTRLARIIVDGKRPIRIGQTYVRVRDADHAVEPERVAKPALATWPVVAAVALGMTILAIDELNVWLTQTAGPKASNYLSPLLTISSAILVWVGLWSVLARIFSGRSRFLPNLLIAMLGVLALSLYNEFAQVAAFAWTWPSAGNYEYVARSTILAAVCFFHLREVGRSHLWLKGALVATLFATLIGVQTVQRSEAFSDFGRQSSFGRLMPPAFRLVPLRDEGAFFHDISKLKAKLDADRTRASADGAER
jgi:pSer/pThr/pTyr-binding forkhead associated (FHA) protein